MSARIELRTGAVQVLELPGVIRVAVGDSRVITARVVDARQLVLIGDAPGRTRIHVWFAGGREADYEVEVGSDAAARVVDEVRALVGADADIRIQQVGERIVLEGRPRDEASRARVEAAARAFPQVINLVAREAAVQRLPAERMIQLDVKVVEVRKRALERLGIRWQADGVAGPSGAVAGYGYANSAFRGVDRNSEYPVTTRNKPFVGYFGIATQIGSVLDLLESDGDSWTLAEPRLSCLSGRQARFVVGGEIPIPVSGANGQVSVVYKSYGIIIEFKPVADEAGNISSAIVAEVSEPDARNSNQGFIAFTQNRTETQALLAQDETLVLSGLLKNRGTRSLDGIPGLANLPVLGNLFRSREYQAEQTELIVLVTPRIATPATDAATVRAQTERAAQLRQQTRRRLAE